MDNANELLPLVDNDGRITGSITRGEAHSGSKALHPVVHLHVFSQNGDIYLQKRPEWKDVQPGKWDTAVGGHIAYGEDVQTALSREAGEELGLNIRHCNHLGKYVFESDVEKELIYVHTTVTDSDIHPSKTELAGGRFWSQAEINENLGKGIFTPNFEHEYRKFFINGSPTNDNMG